MPRILLAFSLLLLAFPARADFLYGITQTDLVVIDPADPSQVQIVGPHGLTRAAYLTYDTATGRLFGLRSTEISPEPSLILDYDLVEYDFCSGAGTVVRNLGRSDVVGAFEVLEYVESQGSLVVSASTPPDFVTSGFYTLDPDTGALGFLVDVGFDNDFGVYDDVRDLFYTWDPNSQAQYQLIDLGDGNVTSLGASGLADRDGAFSEEDGGIFLFDQDTQELVNVETTDGLDPITRTPVGVVAGDPISGLAFTPVPPPVCACAPEPGCTAAGKASLTVVEKKPGNEKLKLSLKKFQGPTSFPGGVEGGSRTTVCLYDENAELLAELDVDRGGETCGAKGKPCWKPKGANGAAYKDPDASAAGVKKIVAVGGEAGKGKLLVQAGNKEKKGQDAMPVGIAAGLQGANVASAQVAVGEGVCVEAAFGNVKKNDGAQFKAKGDGGLP